MRSFPLYSTEGVSEFKFLQNGLRNIRFFSLRPALVFVGLFISFFQLFEVRHSPPIAASRVRLHIGVEEESGLSQEAPKIVLEVVRTPLTTSAAPPTVVIVPEIQRGHFGARDQYCPLGRRTIVDVVPFRVPQVVDVGPQAWRPAVHLLPVSVLLAVEEESAEAAGEEMLEDHDQESGAEFEVHGELLQELPSAVDELQEHGAALLFGITRQTALAGPVGKLVAQRKPLLLDQDLRKRKRGDVEKPAGKVLMDSRHFGTLEEKRRRQDVYRVDPIQLKNPSHLRQLKIYFKGVGPLPIAYEFEMFSLIKVVL